MKRHLLISTMILAASLGAASAEVTLSGSARMGVIDDFGADNTGFTSRARVVFTMSGETDTGLSFGATFRADNAADANSGEAGSVFISGGFGKLSMGDVDGAANAAVGHVDGVGLTGLDDLNEMTYFANGGDFLTSDPSALYEYSVSSLTLYLSSTNPSGVDTATAVGAKYAINDMFTVSAGYEDYQVGGGDVDTQYILGADATIGPVVIKARYSDSNFDTQQTALSATYTMDALSVTGFYMDNTQDGYEAYGLGASYDLGGGAKVVGGYVSDETFDVDAVDLGVSFTF